MQITEANLSLNNVKFKQDALLKLNLPIKIEFGEIKKLDVRYIINLLILDKNTMVKHR